MNDMVKNLILWAVIVVVLMSVFNNFTGTSRQSETVSYSQFIKDVRDGSVREVRIEADNRTIIGTTTSNESFTTFNPSDDNLVDDLLKYNVEIKTGPTQQRSLLLDILISWFPMILLIGVWIFFMRQMQGGGGGAGGRGAMSFGKSKARLMGEDQIKVTFADVAGVEEAKEEVSELVEFLRDPGKFQKLGGKIPRGVLMNGSPGTGKTLLAKAIAGEAKVPFFTISGSDFVEMFVGVGASRVRDMFAQAKKAAPCIIFIDEIDAVGRHRGGGMGGGNDEREQTLNQLLVEMDGFEGNDGVIVIAATNRPDVLDPALLRPGRFDRQVVVGLPDIRGREQILKVHMRKVPISDGVNASVLARATPGFSGADLANLVNEAALFAARGAKQKVTMEEFEKAKDKIMMGAERKSMVMSDKEKMNTAYHEAGHTIVGRLVPEHDPVYKVSIIPRGRALGVTMFLPEEDRYSHSKQSILSQICSLYGGRIAEEMTLGKDGVTTGASNDIQRATQMAHNMVKKWGLSEKLGPLQYDDEQEEVFLGRTAGNTAKVLSLETTKAIDEEVRSIIDSSYSKAYEILKENRDVLEAMKDALMEYETLDVGQIDDLMARKTPRTPAEWDDDDYQSGTPTSANKEEDKKDLNKETKDSSEKPIGGPAGEH